MPELLVTAEEAELEDLALEAILGDGLFALRATLAGREYSLLSRWPTLAAERRLETLTTRYCLGKGVGEMAATDYLLARGRAVVEALAHAPYPEWLPVDEQGQPQTERMRSAALLRSFAEAWEHLSRRLASWLYREKGLNLKRIAGLDELLLRDAVAREMNTHPFDARIATLSRVQIDAMLELRMPADPKRAEGDALQKDADEADARDEYYSGEIKEVEETPEDELDLALYAQSG